MLSIIIAGFFLGFREVTTTDDVRPCDFNNLKMDYNSTDLLFCMYELASNAFGQEQGKSINEKRHETSQGKQHHQFSPPELTGKGITDFIGSFINGGLSLPYQVPSFLSDAIGSYPSYQTNYPITPNLPLSPLSALNLYDALYSISAYDDFKCVPRILCEVASGSKVGGSDYKQSSNFLPEFGQNALFGLLSAFDITGSSPLLNFGKAALLGYTNRENSASCYRQYPKCPRNPAQLIHYLNNHNGGFFRFFNKYRYGLRSSQRYRHYQQQNGEHYGRSEDSPELKLPSVGTDRIATGGIKLEIPSLNTRQGQRIFFPREGNEGSEKKFIFLQRENEKENRELRSSEATSISFLDSTVPAFPFVKVPFFPEVIHIERSEVRFP